MQPLQEVEKKKMSLVRLDYKVPLFPGSDTGKNTWNDFGGIKLWEQTQLTQLTADNGPYIQVNFKSLAIFRPSSSKVPCNQS